MVDRDCKDYNEECKYFHHEPYYTPNNYDLFFDYNNIPVNIPVEKAHDLRNRLQKLMPVTKIIHLNMGSETLKEDNNLHMHTCLKIDYKTPEESIETQLKITGVWDDFDEDLTTDATWEVYSLYEEEAPISNAKIRLINLHYPLLEYYDTTDDEGKSTFEDLPCGTYIQQVLIDGYSIQLYTVEVDENENNFKVYIGSEEEDIPEENDEVALSLYKNGVLIVSSLIYEQGDLSSTTSDEIYEDGELRIAGLDDYEDDQTMVLLHSPGFNLINDFTEFIVDIKGVNGEIVDSLALNFRNNYTKTSRKLPIYNGTTRINYTLSYSQDNCNVTHEYLDLIRFKNNEVKLL